MGRTSHPYPSHTFFIDKNNCQSVGDKYATMCNSAEAKLKFTKEQDGRESTYEVIVNNFNLDLKLYADTMILSWLLDTSEKVGIDYQIKKYFQIDMVSFSQVVKKGEDFSSVELEKATQYAAEDALMTLKLFNKQLEIFKQRGEEELLNIAFELEFNFIYVLASIEQKGIKVDVELLKKYNEESDETKKQLLGEQIASTVVGVSLGIRNTG